MQISHSVYVSFLKVLHSELPSGNFFPHFTFQRDTHSHQLAIMANLNFYHVYKQTIRASSSQPVKETGKRERAGGSEERKSKLQVSPSERRNLALRTTFAYRFHMRHVESFSQPHPPPPFPFTSPPPLECKYNPFWIFSWSQARCANCVE